MELEAPKAQRRRTLYFGIEPTQALCTGKCPISDKKQNNGNMDMAVVEEIG